MHGINRHEIDACSFLRSPITKGALVVLASPQDGKNFFELRGHLLPVQAEIGFVGENEAAKGATRELLAATMRELFQINIEPMSETERQGGDGGDELAELRIHGARRW